jgi:hypothetical protein
MKILNAKIFITLVLLLVVSSNYMAQSSPDQRLDEIKYIYENLEYKTTAFNDLKSKWYVTDPLLIRDAFNRFIVKRALMVDGKSADDKTIELKAEEIFEGNVVINLRKRYYDDEIEYFAFLPEEEIEKKYSTPLFDGVEDAFYLREVIGTTLYDKLKEQTYAHRNLTKDEFNTKAGYYFDINLNFFNPELMFWSTTSNYKDKYLLSFFGKWGNNRLFIPGWFYGEYIGGLQLAYHDALTNDPENYLYEFQIGTGFSANSPYTSRLPQVPLYKSGQSVFMSLSGSPFRYLTDLLDNTYLDLEAHFTLAEYKKSDYKPDALRQFYTIKSYFTAMLEKKDIFNLFDFGNLSAGAGYSTYELSQLEIGPELNEVNDLGKVNPNFQPYESFAIGKIGIDGDGGLIQHEFSLMYGYNLQHQYSYFSLGGKVMLNETFGLAVNFTDALNEVETISPWRSDSYLVFSPFIRINY